MKNLKTFLLLLLVIPFFISCEKDEPEISKECILLDGKFFDGILFYEVINSTDARVKFVDENYREEKIVIPHKIKFDENVFLVTEIDSYAFSGCSGLTSIEIPNSVTSIGECWVFSDCSGLTSIVVEAGNPVYDSRENCNAIIETETNKLIAGCQNSFIPNSVTSIGFGAFDGCSGLTSIEIPNSVTSIGERAFSYCSGLTSVVWNAVIGHLHYKWYHPFEGSTENLTSFVFGDSVQYIPSYLCANMSKLTSIEIPNSVNSIGDGAFYDCSGLTSVTIGNSVISIGKSVFDCCYRIIEINCKPITPPNIDSNSFCYFNATMNVPKGALSNYKNHPIWGKFKNINEVYF